MWYIIMMMGNMFMDRYYNEVYSTDKIGFDKW